MDQIDNSVVQELSLESYFNDSTNPIFCVLDKVKYALVEDKLYQLTGTMNESDDLSAARVIDLPPCESRPPFQWMLPYSNSMLILLGSRPFEMEDRIKRCDELGALSGHEIELPAVLQITTSEGHEMQLCNLCLQARSVKTCWRCYDCGIQGPFSEGCFNVCLRCLQHGSWCRDVSHRRSRSKKGTEILEWKATHFIAAVDCSGDEPFVKTLFQNRLISKASGEPTIDMEREEIIWPVDGTLLKLHVVTGASKVSKVGKEDSRQLEQVLVTLEQRVKDEVEAAAHILPRRIGKHFDSSRWKDGLCFTCVSSLAASLLLPDSTNWKEDPKRGRRLRNRKR
jgi:hypothetical protein